MKTIVTILLGVGLLVNSPEPTFAQQKSKTTTPADSTRAKSKPPLKTTHKQKAQTKKAKVQEPELRKRERGDDAQPLFMKEKRVDSTQTKTP